MILVKHYPSFYIAWIYRILYCKQLDDFLYDQGIFAILDYNIDAATYTKGSFVLIEINFHSDKGQAYMDAIQSLNIDTSDAAIGLAGLQIMAETKKPLSSPSLEKIAQALKELDSQPWRDINDIETIDALHPSPSAQPLTLAAGENLRNRHLTVELILPPKGLTINRNILPLFTYLSEIIHANCRRATSNAYGLYGNGIDKVQHTEGSDARVPFTFQISPSNADAMDNDDYLTAIASIYQECILAFCKEPVVERLATMLQTVSYSTRVLNIPDPGTVLNDTNVLVGAKGWLQIATRQNIHMLLDALVIRVEYGQREYSIRIAA